MSDTNYCGVMKMTTTPTTKTILDLLNEMTLQDAIVSLLEARLPIVVDGLDFFAGTWKGLPIHPKEIGQMEDIFESLSEDKQTVLKYSALCVNWGRRHEIQRLLLITPLGNLSSADAVLGVSGGDAETADENNNS
jgi:hypothetical protein